VPCGIIAEKLEEQSQRQSRGMTPTPRDLLRLRPYLLLAASALRLCYTVLVRPGVAPVAGCPGLEITLFFRSRLWFSGGRRTQQNLSSSIGRSAYGDHDERHCAIRTAPGWNQARQNWRPVWLRTSQRRIPGPSSWHRNW